MCSGLIQSAYKMHTFLLESFDSLRGYAGQGECGKISASGQGVYEAMKTEKYVQMTSGENQIVSDEGNIQALIKTIRGVQVILDRDVSRLYGVATGALNRQVKRNEARFPEDFMFRLFAEEWDNLKCQIGISSWGGDRQLPYAFVVVASADVRRNGLVSGENRLPVEWGWHE